MHGAMDQFGRVQIATVRMPFTSAGTVYRSEIREIGVVLVQSSEGRVQRRTTVDG